MRKNLTSEQLLNLSKEDFIAYMKEVEEEKYNNMSKLEFSNYENLNLQSKADIWCNELNTYMRNQVASGLDEYLLFTPIWYKAMKRLEPDFDLVMKIVFDKFESYGWEWNREEYLKRIIMI